MKASSNSFNICRGNGKTPSRQTYLQKLRAILYMKKIDILYNARFRLLLSCGLLGLSYISRVFSRRRADVLLMKAHHYSDSHWLQNKLLPAVKRIIEDNIYVRSLLPPAHVKQGWFKSKYLFLAKPHRGPREKGVIFICYSEAFNAFLKQYDVERIMRDYYLVLEPEWAGYGKPEILAYARIDHHPVIVESTEPLDFNFIERQGSNLVAAEFGASDWLDPTTFHPIPSTPKKYDCVMVCDWYNYKRNYILLRALSKIKQHRLKAALVSNATGIVDTLKGVARYLGVEDNLTFLRELPAEQLNVVYNESKVNLLLSYKEGSNKTLFEGMLANTPAILIKGNIGVNKNYINNQTGEIVDENRLPETLARFSQNYSTFSPREWVLANISCHKTTEKLNTIIKGLALQSGEDWTQDLRVKVNIDGAMRGLQGTKEINYDFIDQYSKT